MDIKKSQRLSQYLSVVIDMVQFSDVGRHLLECGILSAEEHGLLQSKLREDGNAGVMNELLAMINLRRGGFDAFLQVLRSTDYVWVAEQLDPGRVFTETSSCATTGGGNKKAKMQNLLANVRQTIRKSEPIFSDSSKASEEQLTFMSYRGSCPVEIPIHPRHYMDIYHEEGKTMEQPYPQNKEPQKPLAKNEVAIQLMNLELNSNDQKLNSNDQKLNTIVLVENVPGSLVESSTTTDYFTKLAKRLDVPSSLKVIQTGKISKKTRRGKVNNKVKLEFQSEDIRDNFIQTFKDFIVKLEPGDEMYNTVKQLSISVPNIMDTHSSGVLAKCRPKKRDKSKPSVCFRSNSNTASKNSTCLSESEPSKKHWYQQRFSLKSWKRKKRLTNDISTKL